MSNIGNILLPGAGVTSVLWMGSAPTRTWVIYKQPQRLSKNCLVLAGEQLCLGFPKKSEKQLRGLRVPSLTLLALSAAWHHFRAVFPSPSLSSPIILWITDNHTRPQPHSCLSPFLMVFHNRELLNELFIYWWAFSYSPELHYLCLFRKFAHLWRSFHAALSTWMLI